MSQCIFCKIIAGELPAQKIYEDDKVLAFKDIKPSAPIHYLFVPKEHYESLEEVPAENLHMMVDLYRAIRNVTEKEELSLKGYKTLINTGKGAGQIVFHLHVHLLSGF